MRKNDSVKATLISAKQLLEERGWVRGDYENEQGFCAVGAIRFINGPFEHRAKKVLARAAYKRSPWMRRKIPAAQFTSTIESSGSENMVIFFNDKPNRRKSEVLRAFDDAIEAAGEE